MNLLPDRHPPKTPALLAGVALYAALTLAVTPSVGAQMDTPPGYRYLGSEGLAPGVEHLAFGSADPPQAVRVARIAPDAPFELRNVLSGDAVPGRLERTSSMCLRLACVVGVNGDFYVPRTGEPIGAVISDSEFLRSPAGDHAQLVLSADGGFSTEPLHWNGTILPTDFRTLSFQGVNVPMPPEGKVLYTPSFGAITPTGSDTVELVLEVLRGRASRLRSTSVVRMLGLRGGGPESTIPPNGVVLAARGPAAEDLRHLWQRVEGRDASPEALMRLESAPDAKVSVGGSPVLVKNGEPVYPDTNTSFIRSRHPRTMVGRTAGGELLLVTVDGRQPGHSEGLTISEAAHLMLGLGAVEAINLDGGGSTTFVVGGAVRNRPSDRLVGKGDSMRIAPAPAPHEHAAAHVERPVASALVLAPADAPEPDPELALGLLELPDTVPLHTAHARDPASDPTGHLPAIVYQPAQHNRLVPALGGMLAVLALVLTGSRHHGFRIRLARIIEPKPR